MKKNKPLKTYRAGPCSASIFENEKPTENGPRRYLSIAFACRYRDDATGEWKDAPSMTPNEAARALLVLSKAYEHCVLQETQPQVD